MKKLLFISTLLISTVSFADVCNENEIEQRQPNPYCYGLLKTEFDEAKEISISRGELKKLSGNYSAKCFHGEGEFSLGNKNQSQWISIIPQTLAETVADKNYPNHIIPLPEYGPKVVLFHSENSEEELNSAATQLYYSTREMSRISVGSFIVNDKVADQLNYVKITNDTIYYGLKYLKKKGELLCKVHL